MNTITNVYTKVEQLKSSLFGRTVYPGYRMSKASNDRWDAIEQNKARTQREWEEIERQEHAKQIVIKKAQQLIEWSIQEYTSALLKYQNRGSIKTLETLRLDWSPERVLSTHKDFGRLCDALRDEAIWKMLSRKERAFVADAVGMRKS